MQARHPSYKESVKQRRVPLSTGEMAHAVFQALFCLPKWPTRFNLTRPWIEASTGLTTNLCSPIMMVTFFTILGESSPVAQRNSKFCKDSFDTSVESADCVTDCMRYGLDSRVFTTTTTDSHVSRYCVPMDNQRPQLDLKFFDGICPDQNGVVITFMTFLHNVEMHLMDYPNEYPDSNVSEVAEKQFQDYYLHPLGDDVRFVRLEKMHRQNRSCTELIKKTAAALNEDIVILMLLAVQRGNLELCVEHALNQ